MCIRDRLDTVGTNLTDILAIPYIDTTKTYSNNIPEIYKVLGIEAARQSIYREFIEVLEDSGTYINEHHLSILCDRMTYNSKMISIFRHGINNDNIGPLAKASFEETPEMFIKAAKHAEIDIMKGVSANVMCGQKGYYGTNLCDLYLDIQEFKKLSAEIENDKTEDDEIKSLFANIDDPKDPCSKSNMIMNNNISNETSEQIKNLNLKLNDILKMFGPKFVSSCYVDHSKLEPSGLNSARRGAKHSLNHQKIIPHYNCLLYTSPSPRDATLSRMPSSA